MYTYYITDLFEGNVTGTNDEKIAKDYALCEDYFVIEPAKNIWHTSDESELEIKESSI